MTPSPRVRLSSFDSQLEAEVVGVEVGGCDWEAFVTSP